MRKFLGFLFLLALGACFFLPQVQTELPKILKQSQLTVAQAAKNIGVQLLLVGRQEAAGATPVESIVRPQTLKKTYYYHFSADVPVKVQQVFERAIAVYNETGIVDLVAGQATAEQNEITIFVYQKTMTAKQVNYLELGKGGPEIQQLTGLQGYTANHARAGLNVKYGQSIKESVAIHELGHALGLDHSSNRRSVMYPIDQGLTQLSAGDLKALKYLY
ncbi:Zn-dependent protease [Levilactobacillus brevis]|uniref:M57 family metalloprotease n=1 Tax=Levilactobacillus brevis TaxID=1580 RepID=UPI00111FEBA3|nr:M57 family metalloprotease [Levilactobacillus brevis]TOY84667.1 Zn-dependent protease [Levilactobacillus brevis]